MLPDIEMPCCEELFYTKPTLPGYPDDTVQHTASTHCPELPQTTATYTCTA